MPHRADRGVRPYRTLCVFAENAYNFAIALCRVDVGIDPYGQVALSVFVVRICWCTVRGRGRTPPLRRDRKYCVFTIRCGKFAVAQRADRGVRPYKDIARSIFIFHLLFPVRLTLGITRRMWYAMG